MRYQLLNSDREKTYAVIFETGDKVMEELLAFGAKEQLAASRFTAIGAFREVMLGYFDWQRKDYNCIPLAEQVEVLSLIGDVTRDDEDMPKLHAHVVVGRSDGTANGGHLLEATVRPTLEV